MGGTTRIQSGFTTANDDDVRDVPGKEFVFVGGDRQGTGGRPGNERRIERPGFGAEIRNGEFITLSAVAQPVLSRMTSPP